MFYMSSLNLGGDVVGTIRFKEFPKYLGWFKDVEGQTWDVQGLLGGKHVIACKKEQLHPYYTSTSTNYSGGCVSQKWYKYAVEVTG